MVRVNLVSNIQMKKFFKETKKETGQVSSENSSSSVELDNRILGIATSHQLSLLSSFYI